MTFPASFIDHPVSQAVAWALVHFAWQGALIGLAALAALRLFRLAPPARYAAGIVALLLMAAAPIVTTVVMLGDGRPAVTATVAVPASSAPVMPSDAIDLAGLDAVQPAVGTGAAVPELRRLPLESIVLIAWLVGVAVLSLRLLGGWIVARRLTHRSVRPASPDVQSLAQRIAGRLALDRVVRVVESSAVAVPMLVGWLKPVVLLPASALSGLTPTQVEALLAHELAHVRRHDYLVNLLQSVVETLLFYHPAVWWVSRQVRREREHCCDDLAVGVCDRLEYVSALASLAAMTTPPQPALAATDGSLVGRVRRLLSPDADERPSSMAGWVAVSVIVLGAVLALRSVPEAAEPGMLDEQTPVAATQPSVAQAAATPTPAGSPVPASQASAGVAVAAGPAQGARGGVATGVAGGVATGVAGGVATGVTGGVATGVAATVQDPDKVRAIRQAEQELRRAQREIEMRRIELDLERAKIEASVQLEAAASQIEILKRQMEKTKQMVDVGLATPEMQASLEAQLAAAHQQLKMAEADLRLRERDIALRVREAEARALYEQRMIELDVARLSHELAQAGTAIEATAVREAVASARAIEAAARASSDIDRAAAEVELQKRLAELEAALAGDPERARRVEEQYRDIVERYGRMSEAVPVDAAEPARVGDSIEIEIAGEPELQRPYAVQGDGTIRFPFLGRVRVLGLTAAQIREAVARQLSERNLLANPTVTVTIRRPR